MDTKTFTLLTPISDNGVQITEVTLNEPTVGELEDMQKNSAKYGDVAAIKALIAKQTSIPVGTITTEVRARDWNAMAGYISDFFAAVPATGNSG